MPIQPYDANLYPTPGVLASMKPDLSKLPADAASVINAPPQFVQFSNPGTGNAAPNAGTLIQTTKNPDGSTRTANGTVPGTSRTINNPA